MPKTEPADVLKFATVQTAIGDIIIHAAREVGIADKYAGKMRAAVLDRVVEGSPVEPAIRLVDAVQEATIYERANPYPWQEDTRKLLLALGLGDHARPISCHQIIETEILPAINRLVARASRVPAEGGETGRTLERNKGLGT